MNRERMITVAVRNDLWIKKEQEFKWPEVAVQYHMQMNNPKCQVKHMLDPVPQKRYLLPQRRMYEFEEATNSGSN